MHNCVTKIRGSRQNPAESHWGELAHLIGFDKGLCGEGCLLNNDIESVALAILPGLKGGFLQFLNSG